MTGKRNNRYFTFLLYLNLIAASSAQVVSPFNNIAIKDTSGDYSFVVSGHFHGSSCNVSSFPASTVLGNIDTINNSNASFIICLGDLFLDMNEMYIRNYQKSFFSKLKIPLFNAVGNHDLSNGNIYEKTYGKTFFSFIKGRELFVILNTEINDGSIKNEQLAFLKQVLNNAGLLRIRSVFIFSHRPVWAERIDAYKNLFVGNTHTEYGKNNFLEDVAPLLQAIPKKIRIFWMSGSMAEGPASFFYDVDERTGITFIQTAIRNLSHDAILKINIKGENVSLEGISLTGSKIGPVESYGIDFWRKKTGADDKIEFRMWPYLIYRLVSHYYFWTGFICCAFLALLFTFFRNR